MEFKLINMKKILIFITFICILNTDLYSQLSLSISEVYVYSKVDYIEGDFDSDEGDGPFLSLKLLFENKGNKLINLYPSKANVRFLFFYDGKHYETKQEGIYNMIFEDLLVLKPNDVKIIKLNTNILMNTNLISRDKTDFFNILFCILPTLRISYEDSGEKLITNGIGEVKLTTY